MIRKMFGNVMAIGSVLYFLVFPTLPLLASPPFDAFVRIQGTCEPETCYKLISKDGIGRALKDPMPVKNGDKIQPSPSKQCRVILDYVHTECKDINEFIKLEEVVNCDKSSPKKWYAGFLDTVSAFRKEAFDEGETGTRKSEGESSELSDPFRLSPLPPANNSTLLGKFTTLCDKERKIFFRWFKPGIKLNAKAELIIRGKNAPEPIEIRVGEMKAVNVQDFKPGQSYEWLIRGKGETGKSKQLSGTYRFKILEEDKAKDIQSQLKEVRQYADKKELADLSQAAYLQFLSDSIPNLELYADSLSFLQGYFNASEVPVKLLNRLERHIDSMEAE